MAETFLALWACLPIAVVALFLVSRAMSAQDKVYEKLLGDQSVLTGASLQNPWHAAHGRTLRWVTASQRAGRPWVVANDEQNPAGMGVPPDPGYAGSDGNAIDGNGNPQSENTRYCFAKPGDLYLVYLPNGGKATLNLNNLRGQFSLQWFNPRRGGPLRSGNIGEISGGEITDLGTPPSDAAEDWLVVVHRK